MAGQVARGDKGDPGGYYMQRGSLGRGPITLVPTLRRVASTGDCRAGWSWSSSSRKKGGGGSFPAPPTPRLRISASNRVFISVFERAAWLIRKRRVGDTLLDNSMVWKSGKVVLEATF